MPTMDDYYEPWTYNYSDLFNSPLGDDQPTARPISRIDGKPIDIESGPNWDDDLGGSNIYAINDPLLKDMTAEEKQRLFSIEQLFYFYMPRICNHCLNAACGAACPSGAIYKRAEDGVVLINQDKCAAGACVFQLAPTKKPTTTGQLENLKMYSLLPTPETDKPPPVSTPVLGAFVISGFCCMTRTRFQTLLKCRMNNSLNASVR